MTKKLRLSILAVAFVLSFALVFSCATGTTFAAGKKTVYVCTKITCKDYTDDMNITAKFSYKKNGLLKKAKLDSDGWFSIVYTYKYNKRSQIKQSKQQKQLLGVTISGGKTKYTYSKKGYVKQTVVYNENGKKTSIRKIKINRKGFVVAEREYNGKGKLKTTIKYSSDKDGNTTEKKKFNSKGELVSTEKYTGEGNTATIKKYNAKGKLIETTIDKLKNGNVVSRTIYDETNGHEINTVAKYTYKKVKTSKASKVKKQQSDFTEFIQ